MPKATNEDLKENAGLVRDVIAVAGIDYPADEFEKRFREALFKKAFTVVSTMDVAHVRRIHEALCDMDFPDASALALRRETMRTLARIHSLKAFRDVKLPTVPVSEKGARK